MGLSSAFVENLVLDATLESRHALLLALLLVILTRFALIVPIQIFTGLKDRGLGGGEETQLTCDVAGKETGGARTGQGGREREIRRNK